MQFIDMYARKLISHLRSLSDADLLLIILLIILSIIIRAEN